MTTTTANRTPEPDTKPEAIEPKTDKVLETKGLNLTNLWLGMAVSVFILGGGIVGIATFADRADQRSLRTETDVKELKTSVAKIPTIEVTVGYIKESQGRVEDDIKEVKRLLEARK